MREVQNRSRPFQNYFFYRGNEKRRFFSKIEKDNDIDNDRDKVKDNDGDEKGGKKSSIKFSEYFKSRGYINYLQQKII